jgi:hypothetical protein
MTISAQGEISRSSSTESGGSPMEGEQKAAYTIAAEGLLEFGPDLKKEKQLRSS